MASLVKLSSVGSLYASAAESYERARIEIRLNHGWDLRPTDSASAMRTLAQQEAVFRRHYTRTRNTNSQQRIWKGVRWYRRTGSPAVATPGTSNHGKGDTVDFTGLGGFSGTRYKQWARIAPYHGWNNREGSLINESWHWTHVAADDDSAKAAGWYHVSRDTGTNSYSSDGKKKTARKYRSNVKITGTIKWGGSLWGVTTSKDLFRMSHLTKGKAPSFAPRWYTVTANTLNGRSGPGESYKVKVKRSKGFRVYVVKKSGDWVGTRYGTWYHTGFLK